MQLTQTHTVCILIEKTRPSLQEISSKTRSFTSIRYYKFKHSILYRKCLYRPHPSQEQSLQTMSFTGTISSNIILYRNHFFKPCPFQDLHFFHTDSFTGPVFTKKLPANNIVSTNRKIVSPCINVDKLCHKLNETLEKCKINKHFHCPLVNIFLTLCTFILTFCNFL